MSAQRRRSWLVEPRPRVRARVRLVCFPFAGGDAGMFHAWPDLLPDDIEVMAVQLPGRANRFDERPFDAMEPLVSALARELAPLADGPPVALFGHSMGALVAFEVARRVRLPLVHLFPSACSAPRLPRRGRALHRLSDAELVVELGRLGGTPRAVLENPELLEIFVPLLRADLQVCEAYVFGEAPRLKTPITAFGGVADPLVDHRILGRWAEETDGPFALHMLPGDHFFAVSARPTVARLVGNALATVR